MSHREHLPVGRAHAHRTDSAHRDADPGPVPGRRTLTQDHPPGAHVSRETLTGRYVGAEVTAELNQVRETIVGRLAVREDHWTGRPSITSYRIASEVAWDNAGSTGFRGTATRTSGARHDGVRITLVFAREGRVHIELDHVPDRHTGADGVETPVERRASYELRRRSKQAAASDEMVAQASPVERAEETMPLDAKTEVRRGVLVREIGHILIDYYNAQRDIDRTGVLLRLDARVGEHYGHVPSEQRWLFTTRVRIGLEAERRAYTGADRTLLDWVTIVLRRETMGAGATAASLLRIPFGADARESATPHTYQFTLVEAIVSPPMPPPLSVQGRRGVIRVTEVEGPGCQESWTRWYPISRGSLGFAIEAGQGGSAGEVSLGSVTVPDHWRPDDFIGPVGGVLASAGVSGSAGPISGGPEASDEVLEIRGDGSFAPIMLHPDTEITMGMEASIGASAGIQGGDIRGMREPGEIPADTHTRHETEVRVPAEVIIQIAFDTDGWTLTPRGERAVRELVAWNLAVLRAPDVRVVVDGFASRRWSAERNMFLSQARQQTVIELLGALVPGLAGHIERGDARGEDAAAEVIPDDPDDNSQEWRSAEIRINGTMVLQMFGAMRPVYSRPGLLRFPHE